MAERTQKLTIVVTDSGLGGLSTTADLCQRLLKASPAPQVEVIFFNALADLSFGYQAMKTVPQKVAVFNNALKSMYETCHPDAIYIACNTLSVIHEQTEFSQHAPIPVIGIVDASVALIMEQRALHPDAYVIILGTPTTINSGTYPKRLQDSGVPAGHIISEACSTVHVEIEIDPLSQKIAGLIDRHIHHAVSQLPSPDVPIIASLNCTHYGYAEEAFKSAFAKAGANVKALINPNTRMTDELFKDAKAPAKAFSIKVISQAEVDTATMATMAQLLGDTSPDLVQALRHYEHNPDLFEWKFAKNEA